MTQGKRWQLLDELRGLILVSLSSFIAGEDMAIYFGILSFLGTAMLLLIPLEGALRRFEPKFGAAGCLALFLLFRDVNEGFLGAYGLRFLAMPEGWYSNYFSTFLGFPPQHFSSADYFSLFPWIFLFVMGYFFYGKLQ